MVFERVDPYGNIDQMALLTSLGELEALLAASPIDLSTWGVDDAKTMADLWREIMAGETQLQVEPLRRVVSVVQVIIVRGNLVLVETQQVLQDGRTRSRELPPSEKMHPGEHPADAATRCLREELEVEPGEVELVNTAHPPTRQSRASPSYPGLQTDYLFHRVDVRVPSLPDQAFATAEAVTGDALVTRHDWAWRDANRVLRDRP